MVAVVARDVDAVFTPHGFVLHVTTSISLGGHVPELFAGKSGRWRKRIPPPHVAEQMQSLGKMSELVRHVYAPYTHAPHGGMAHDTNTSRLEHGAPPFAGGTTIVRVRRCTPAPQDTEHGPSGTHADSTQSTGAACAMGGHARSAPDNNNNNTAAMRRRCLCQAATVSHGVRIFNRNENSLLNQSTNQDLCC